MTSQPTSQNDIVCSPNSSLPALDPTTNSAQTFNDMKPDGTESPKSEISGSPLALSPTNIIEALSRESGGAANDEVPKVTASPKSTRSSARKIHLNTQNLHLPAPLFFPNPTSNIDPSTHSTQQHPGLPELSDLILSLSLDPDFEAFFNSLVDILDKYFQATRATISIPNDQTDIIAVPWALKAIWSKHAPVARPTKSRESSFDIDQSASCGFNTELFCQKNSSFDGPSERCKATVLPSQRSHGPGPPLDDVEDDTEGGWVDDNHLNTGTNHDTTSHSGSINPHSKSDTASSFSSIQNTHFARPESHKSPNDSSASISYSSAFRHKFSLTRKLSRSSLKRIPSFSRRSFKMQFEDKPTSSTEKPIYPSISTTIPPALSANDEHRSRLLTRSSSRQRKVRSSTDSRVLLSDLHDLHSNVGSRPTSLYATPQANSNIKIFDRFSSLDYEIDPLIDAQGVVHVLECNSIVYLQRKYREQQSDVACSNSSCPEYIDSEQAMNSPWTVSLAPSPAIREKADDYMFPTVPHKLYEMDDAFDDEDDSSSINITAGTAHQTVDAIGCENTTTILHIPLVVPTRISGEDCRDFHGRPVLSFQDKAAPLAILSVMTPLIPFPIELKRVLQKLTPHIATAYMRTSINSGLTTQLESLTRIHNNCSSRLRRYGNSNQSLRSTSISVLPTSSEKRASPDKLKERSVLEANVSPKKKPIIRRHRTRSYVRNMLQSHGASFMLSPEVVSPHASSAVTSPTQSSTPPHQSSNYYHWRRSSHGYERAVPSSRLLRTIIDAIPIQVFTLEPVTGEVTWVSNRTLAYNGQTAEEFFQKPHKAIHPDERDAFIAAWTESLKKGESLGMVINVRRFDGRYRATLSRTVPLRDGKGVITHWICSMMDIHKQREAELEALQRARETVSDQMYKILADATPIIVFTFHPDQGIVYANNTWFNYSGCSKEETYGYEYLKAVHPDDRILCLGHFQKDFGLGPHTTELRLLDKNKEYNWHLLTFTSIDVERTNDPSSLWFGTCTNINNQKLIQEKLQEAKDAAQRTIESKTRFLSNMSHEIRTPLIGISGMVSFLLDTKLSEEQLDYCHTISSSSDALLMVINDILDLSKVESGKMTLTNSWFHVRRLVEEANEFLSSMAISKSLELNYIVESNVPVWVRGDRIRLRQVLLNVIGNAIKFTDHGEIFTRCSVSSQETEKNWVMLKFECVDTGRGFTTEDEHRMFKPFSQLKSMPNHSTSSGTGLGLVISRQLIQLHGGTLTCNGEKDKGSTFVFTCKVKLPTDDDGPSEEDRSKFTNGSTGEVSSVRNSVDLNILVICPYKYAAESIVHQIRGTVADPARCQCIVAKDGSLLESCGKLPNWTHVIINVIKVEEAVDDANKILSLIKDSKRETEIVMLSTPLQRSHILEGIEESYKNWAKIIILYKPLKPSRYSLVFDPSKEREASQDFKMQSAQVVLESQKNIFKSIGSFAKDKKHRVLLAEDNLINQKVMGKFFVKSGLHCDIAADGEDCVSRIFAKEPGYYDLILVWLTHLIFSSFHCSNS